MADNSNVDLFLKFTGDDGDIAGESGTTFDKSDKLAYDFTPGKFFEVEEFTVKTGISDTSSDSAVDELAASLKDSNKTVNEMSSLLKQGKDGDKYKKLLSLKSKSGEDFLKWREGTLGNEQYPVDLKPIEFTRPIDKASTTILTYCIKRKLFKSAALIKRRAAGGQASGQVFLRMDFTTVLINNIDWDDAEPPNETCEFVCRAIDIQYLPQLPDGSLGAAIPAKWRAPADEDR